MPLLDFWTHGAGKPLQDWKLIGRPGRVIVKLAMEVDCTNPACGWDEFSQSAKLPDCVVCNGRGKIIVFQNDTLRARVVWAPTHLQYVVPSPGVELGDVALGIDRDDLPVIQKVLDSQRSYIIIDNETVRPTNTSANVIPGIEEAYLVGCNKYDIHEWPSS